MNSRLAYTVLLVGSFLWCALLVLAPLVSSIHPTVSHLLYSFFAPICHQDDARSLHIAGHKLAVCIRCSAIYFGFFAGILAVSRLRRWMRVVPKTTWLVAITPMMLDVLCDITGIHASNATTRVVTGGFFGIIAAQLIVPVAVQALTEVGRFFSHSRGTLYESKTG
ncbi:MAG: DUF2085 domain-containing protein [Ignavibacteriae bacterium]|nr:DUF2085 domain-containing protein [Ignavibacteria bacterium]MBI3365849.1 DUF2085 domain-containing protein [Ignavibacteriota bacterium]